MTRVRPVSLDDDAGGLWRLKQAFETSLGVAGDESKATTYEEKLTDGYREAYLDWVRRCVDESPASVQVAVTDEGVVGYVFVLPESFSYIWDAGVLNEIFVEPPHRGTGIADELLETAFEVLRSQELPLDRVVLDVDRENPRARRFYERHGFTHWGELVARDL